MSKLHNTFKATRLSIWLLVCVLILAATSVYATGDQRPLAAVDILGSPDAAVDGKFAVGTTIPGNKALTVAGVIDFVGAGTVHNYFTQGPGNNMQIRSNVDEYNAVGNGSYAQWNMVMGASLDVFSIRRSPASSTYNEDALFWIEGASGNIGIAKVDTSNGATIPFLLSARLHVETDSGTAIYGYSTDTNEGRGVWGIKDGTGGGAGVQGVATASSGSGYGIWGISYSTDGKGVLGSAEASSGNTYGVYGRNQSDSGGAGVLGNAEGTGGNGVIGQSSGTNSNGVAGVSIATSGVSSGVHGVSYSTDGRGVSGSAAATSGYTFGVHGQNSSTDGSGVFGEAYATTGLTSGVIGRSDSSGGNGVYGFVNSGSGTTYGVYGLSLSTDGNGVYGYASASFGTTYGVFGRVDSISGHAVRGWATASSGTNYGVYGQSASTSGYDFYAAGAGTDYGPFTGAHEVRLSDSFPQEIQTGMIVSASGEAHVRQAQDGSVDLSSTLPTVNLSDTAEDPTVLGVLVAEVTLPEDHWYVPAEGERFGTVNALGEGRVWVTNINGEISAGDYITTSAVPGYGQRQEDDFLHSYTLAKATETIDWGSVTETVTFNGQEYNVYLLAVVYTSG